MSRVKPLARVRALILEADPEVAEQWKWMGTPVCHIPMSDDTFVLCAGSTELRIGLCLMFGIFPRLIVASMWLLINMSLTVFSWVELVGHLPLYGVMRSCWFGLSRMKISACGSLVF